MPPLDSALGPHSSAVADRLSDLSDLSDHEEAAPPGSARARRWTMRTLQRTSAAAAVFRDGCEALGSVKLSRRDRRSGAGSIAPGGCRIALSDPLVGARTVAIFALRL